MYLMISSACMQKYSAKSITIRRNRNIDLVESKIEDHLNRGYTLTEVVISSYMY